jgi:hypothetical protein
MRPKSGVEAHQGKWIEPGQRARDEEGERDQHPGRPAAQGEQRARRAGAAQLHADPEQERAHRDRDADRLHRAGDAAAEQLAARQHGQEHQAGHAQHHHLRAQPGPAPLGQEVAPAAGKAEGGVVQADAQQYAEDEQRTHAPAGGLQHDRAHRRHGGKRGQHDRAVDAGAAGDGLGAGRCVDGAHG